MISVQGGGATYGGGVVLAPDVTLIGSGAPLVAGGVTLLNAAGAPPVVTNSGGPGITLADGDNVSGLTVQGTSGDGIYANGVGSFTSARACPSSVPGGDGLDVNGGGGTIDDGGADQRLGRSLGGDREPHRRHGTLSGAITDTGRGRRRRGRGRHRRDHRFHGRDPVEHRDGARVRRERRRHRHRDPAGEHARDETARALEVSGGSTIGDAGLTFQSVSAGTSTAGPDYGIWLDGPTGGGAVSVVGSGTAGSGGTIENTTYDGVYALNVATLNLSSLDITGAGRDGIDAQAQNGAIGGAHTHGERRDDGGVDLPGRHRRRRERLWGLRLRRADGERPGVLGERGIRPRAPTGERDRPLPGPGYDGVSDLPPTYLNAGNTLQHGVAGASATTVGGPFTSCSGTHTD